MSCQNECGQQNPSSLNCVAGVNPVDVPGILKDRACETCDCVERRSDEFCEPICISVDKVYDACRERNCIVDERVYFTKRDQKLVDDAINVKLKKAEILWVYTDTEPVLYSSGCYSIDIKYFIDVTVDVFACLSEPKEIHGLVTYDKRVMLFGSTGETKSFSSTVTPTGNIEKYYNSSNQPKVTVEVVNPIALSAKIVDDTCCCSSDRKVKIPTCISNFYDEELVIANNIKKVLVSIGLFTIVRLERKVQILVDAIDFCIPEKTCSGATPERPCELFNTVRFPIDQFFPPTRANNFAQTSCCSSNNK